MASITLDLSMKLLSEFLSEIKVKTVAETEFMNSIVKCIQIIANYQILWETRIQTKSSKIQKK